MTSSNRLSYAIGGVVLLLVVVAWFSRSAEGTKALTNCDLAMKRGDAVDAIVYARAAAESRCPLCSAPASGYERLEKIAKEAEGRAEDTVAVAAWRAVRAAALSSALFDTNSDRKQRADQEIARLEHRIDLAAAATGGSPASPAANEERLRAVLQASSVPATPVFLLLAAGGALFLLGAARFVRGGDGPRSRRTTDAISAALGIGVAFAGLSLF